MKEVTYEDIQEYLKTLRESEEKHLENVRVKGYNLLVWCEGRKERTHFYQDTERCDHPECWYCRSTEQLMRKL